MSHNISHASGRAEIAYAGEHPWHSLGTPIPDNASMEEVIEAAGLDWTVSTQPIFQRLPNNKSFREVAGHQLIVRDDTQDILGVTGDRFTPLQNLEAFKAMESRIRPLGARYDVAGALGVGETVWVSARLSSFEVQKGDALDRFLLLTNGHDGKHSLRILIACRRVVCQNTLILALAEGQGKGFRGVHSALLKGKLSGAVDEVLEVEGIYKQAEEAYGRMLTVRMNKEQVDQYFKKVFKIAEKNENDKPSRVLAELSERFDAPTNRVGNMAGTVWAAYQAAVEAVDHGGRRTQLDARAKSLLFGPGAITKARAFEEAVALIK